MVMVCPQYWTSIYFIIARSSSIVSYIVEYITIQACNSSQMSVGSILQCTRSYAMQLTFLAAFIVAYNVSCTSE